MYIVQLLFRPAWGMVGGFYPQLLSLPNSDKSASVRGRTNLFNVLTL